MRAVEKIQRTCSDTMKKDLSISSKWKKAVELAMAKDGPSERNL